jgi:predicted metal-dependent hydrolase
LGYPALSLEDEIRRKTRWAQKNLPLRTRLAFTVCAEHFTAVLADAILSDEFPRTNLDPLFLAMWRWHAIEEIEHKAVAFDVYDQLEATYAHRVLTMMLVTAVFSYDATRHANAMMRADGIEPSEGWKEIRKIFFSETKLGWRILKNYLRFYKPGFHPWDHRNTHHLERWNAGYEGLLRSLGMAA